MATLSKEVRYPLGSMEEEVPEAMREEAVPEAWSSFRERILSRACPISTKFVSVPSAGVSKPPFYVEDREELVTESSGVKGARVKRGFSERERERSQRKSS